MEGIHVFLTWLNTCMIKCTQHHWFCYVPGFTATYTLRQALLQWSIHSCTLFLILLKLITLRICTIECEEKDEILYPCTKYTNTKKTLISRKVSPKYDFLRLWKVSNFKFTSHDISDYMQVSFFNFLLKNIFCKLLFYVSAS